MTNYINESIVQIDNDYDKIFQELSSLLSSLVVAQHTVQTDNIDVLKRIMMMMTKTS